MLNAPILSPGQKLRDLMAAGIVTMPGVFNGISAITAFKAGSQALYLSGAGATNAWLGAPDIAIISQTELAAIAAQCCSVAPVPILSDADTGFGETSNVMRTVIDMERAGLAGIHLEDQVSPKRCGHLDGKDVIPAVEMEKKLRAAVDSKRDSSFIICARTDARGVEGLDSAVERAKRYAGAGADAIFPEGLESEAEFEAFRSAVDVPLLANMTEFGKTPIIPVSRFKELGYNMVIFPMTAFRMMLQALDQTYKELIQVGTQEKLLDQMKTRKELYQILGYDEYTAKDAAWANTPER
ncbi:MAG: methylisocitrate lyase [Fimbriimonadaceae bacterium]